MTAWFLEIKWLHIVCVIASGGLFFVRGCLVLAGVGIANHRAVKWLSYLIDTTLLAAAIALVVMLHQYPFVQAWLTVKVLLLVVYIGLGVFALRRGRTRASRALFFVLALAVYAFIISVAIAHHPAGIIYLMGRG